MNSWYESGKSLGEYRRDNPEYDARWDFADAAKAGKQEFADFKRGFEEGMEVPA